MSFSSQLYAKHETQTCQSPITVCSDTDIISADLKWVFLLLPLYASSQALTMRTNHAVYCTGQVSGFIIFRCHLHNARGIKFNLHNFFDYTCYEMWVTLIYKMAWYKVNGWCHLLAPLPFLGYSQRMFILPSAKTAFDCVDHSLN